MAEARRKEQEREKETDAERGVDNLKTWLGTQKRGCTTTPVHARTASRYSSQFANHKIIATCPSCSLIIRVIHDPVRVEPTFCAWVIDMYSIDSLL